MARNVFVSYKYSDEEVQHICGLSRTTARDYVNEVVKLLSAEDHVYCGEPNDEDLSSWSEDDIWERLKDRIFPTTCTIVLISPKMKEPDRYDKSQWIPWEICYSIKETVRNGRKSHRNAMLAVVLPDLNGSYDYAIKANHCCVSGCTTYYRDWMFTIIKNNMFNRKDPDTKICPENGIIWYGEPSYIPMVRWDYFVDHVTELIERAERIKNDCEINDSYILHLSVNQ